MIKRELCKKKNIKRWYLRKENGIDYENYVSEDKGFKCQSRCM